jgi:hypothetical protein
MIETRLQIPDDLYREAERVAREREITLGEVVRRGLEYIVRVYPPVPPTRPEWHPPPPRSLGHFQAPVEDWRLLANEPDAPRDLDRHQHSAVCAERRLRRTWRPPM